MKDLSPQVVEASKNCLQKGMELSVYDGAVTGDDVKSSSLSFCLAFLLAA